LTPTKPVCIILTPTKPVFIILTPTKSVFCSWSLMLLYWWRESSNAHYMVFSFFSLTRPQIEHK
jgi:hypothetical protein